MSRTEDVPERSNYEHDRVAVTTMVNHLSEQCRDVGKLLR